MGPPGEPLPHDEALVGVGVPETEVLVRGRRVGVEGDPVQQAGVRVGGQDLLPVADMTPSGPASGDTYRSPPIRSPSYGTQGHGRELCPDGTRVCQSVPCTSRCL